jgi:hypothetical protein
MMRKWLFVGLVLAILYALSKANARRWRERYPILKRIDRTISLLAWTLLTVYGLAFLYWFYTRVIH